MTSAQKLLASVRAIRRGGFWTDTTLRDNCLDVAAPSYVDPSAVLYREWSRCDTLYLACDSHGLQGFYLARFDIVDTGGRWLPTVYMGLSATRDGVKGKGIGNMLYAHGLTDALKWQAQEHEKLILWTTTATPIVYLRVQSGLKGANPRPDGSYSADAAAIAAAICRDLGKRQPRTHHPFVLKGIANDIRYSAREAQRIQQTKAQLNFTLFDELGIDEAQGDRLLVFGEVPSAYDESAVRTRWVVSSNTGETLP
jgi:hypothetical protein